MTRPRPPKKIRLGQFYTSTSVAALMVELADVPRSADVCEAGFGEGVFLDALLAQGFTNIVGYDIDADNHARVSERFAGAVDARCLNYLLSARDERFDLIIGNPPYVQWNNIDEGTRELLRGTFWERYSNGEWDLLYAFIIWSVEKLRDSGELILIVPYNWFNATYAASLRQYLAEHGAFELLLHFSEYKCFADAAPNAIIFKYRKGPPLHPYLKVAEFEGRRGEIDELLTRARHGFAQIDCRQEQEISDGDWRFYSGRHLRGSEPWYLASPEEERAVERLEVSASARLGEHYEVAVGLVSGYDAAFALTDEEYAALPERERELVVEMVKAASCSRYRLLGSAHYIFADQITDEKLLRHDYPTVYARLAAHREKLDERYGAGGNKQWWHWATVRNLTLFQANRDTTKLFVPGIDRSQRSRFAATDRPVFGAGDVICVAPSGSGSGENMLYVLGWLNSTVVNNWYRIKGSRTGHRTRYTQAYVSQMPYLPVDFDNPAAVALHDRVVVAVRAAQAPDSESVRRAEVEAEIDRVFELLLALPAA